MYVMVGSKLEQHASDGTVLPRVIVPACLITLKVVVHIVS